MSQLTPLLALLKASGSDRVFFTPNEPGYALEGETRRPVTNVPVSGATILEAISELLSQDDIQGLSSTRPRIVRHEHEGEDFVLEVVRHANGVALGIRQAAKPGRALRDSVRREEPAPATSGRPSRRKMRAVAPSAPAPEPGFELGSRVANGPPPAIDARAATVTHAVEIGLDSVRQVVVSAQPMNAPAPHAPQASDTAALREIAREAARDVARAVALEVVHEAVRDLARLAPATAGEPAAARPMTGDRAPARSGPARVDALLREMIQSKASDLHLSPGTHPVMRVDGEIHFGRNHAVLTSQQIFEMVGEIMTERARGAFERTHDADFAYEIPGLARFRVNVFQDRNGTGAVFRQIPIEILSAEKLDLPKACLDLCWLTKGLVLVTGPTGSGKSTTLAAMIDFINKNRSDHIITIEDPVEFVHKNQRCLVNQREVGRHTTSFKSALRAALREDPDIVLVGEMRDLETISIALETAETGHLVFGTLHTTTAISTVDRIIDQFPADRQAQIRVMLSESLKGVIAQVLCPKIGGGRVAAHEILLGTPAVASLIREGKTFQIASIMQTSKAQGMVTMNDSLMSLVQRKLVDPKQAYLKAVDKNGFANMLRSAGINPPV
jgi:twitching motility protein PilT